MSGAVKRLYALNDFAFMKILGEKGDETQLTAFLNAVLKRTGKDSIVSVEIIENKELPPEIIGGKLSKLDVRAMLGDGTRIDIEVQLKNEYNMEKRSLRYWALEYTRGIVEGQDYIDLPCVIVINILDFSYIGLDDFHTSFHIYEDMHRDYMLTSALEMHYIDMVRFRKYKGKDLNEPFHRWLIYFDEQSPPELVEEVLNMDTAIRAAQDKMEMIRRDPALLHAYDMYELTRIDYKLGMQGARQEGLQEGRQEGLREGLQKSAYEIARRMKNRGAPPGQIAGDTGLSIDEITKL
ncbi:MAG: Rpn family recombination-promoting nuclease/putative transposase [Spirochaetaceae bacterium]|jgi:predicted transposase/invertase (TIGR01784 family)|nr:Rpn family recombination-promoting nuclease/putative transposase [Spirochaetaceae bacterium]